MNAFTKLAATFNGGPPPAGLDQISGLFTAIVKAATGLAFVAVLVILVVASIKFLTSGGEPKAVASARDAVTWALLGILFMAIAWLILQLIQAFTGVKVTIFDIKVLCGASGC